MTESVTGWQRSMLAAAAALVLALTSVGCAATPPTDHAPDPTSTDSASPPVAGPAAARPRPRADLTPGALNPDVTQATIAATICKTGWTATVRPPSSYTGPLKVEQIKQYGYTDTNPADYEEDHLVPLELGGAPRDERNLWPQPRTESGDKDKDENSLHAAVCAGRMTLNQARASMLATWGPS